MHQSTAAGRDSESDSDLCTASGTRIISNTLVAFNLCIISKNVANSDTTLELEQSSSEGKVP